MYVDYILLEKNDFFTSIFIIIWSVICDFTMPTKKKLYLSRSQRKQKLIELEHNAPIKTTHLSVMKVLASEYLKSNNNGKLCFDKFYKEKRNIYPWLKKELLQWHSRNQHNWWNIDTPGYKPESALTYCVSSNTFWPIYKPRICTLFVLRTAFIRIFFYISATNPISYSLMIYP